jgi:hypothetical protein
MMTFRSGLAEQVPVPAHETHDGVVAFRARAGEKHAVELGRRQVDQLLGQLDRGRVGRLEKTVVVRQLEHLAVRCFGEFAAAVPEVDTPQPRHAVEHPVAFRIVEVDAVGFDDDAGAFRMQVLVIGERVQVVLPVQLLPGGRVAIEYERCGCGHVRNAVWS